MDRTWIILLIVLAVVAIIMAVLYFLGRRLQANQEEQQAQIDAIKQTISMLIIDKKKMKITQAGLPPQVIESVPKYMRWSKIPVVKAKVGPQIVTLVSEASIFDDIPIKKEVKAVVSGIYITEVKGLHGKQKTAPQKSKGKFKQWVERMQEKAGAKPL